MSSESLKHAPAAPVEFAAWARETAVWPVGALVEHESPDCVVIKLVNFTGRVLESIPVTRALYDKVQTAITTQRVPLHQFILEAVEAKCARQKGGAR